MLTATPAHNATSAPQADNPSLRVRVQNAATRSVSADSVALARIIFGLLITYSSLRFLAKGWVDRLWIDPEVHLTYRWFEWVQPLPASWMYLLPLVLAAAGIAIAVGWHHRVATAVFLIGFTYTELIDAALYLNHYWFMTLVGILMFALPVDHHWSLDARAGRVSARPVVPMGVVWTLRAQLGVVYFFAGLAKLNPDWLLRAQPLRLWLSDRSDVPFIGGYLDTDAVAYVASWSAASFDLTIVAWLLWRRSRRGAWLALVVFHIATGALFQIGVFPLVMGAMALIFFEPDWPRRLIRSWRPASTRRNAVPRNEVPRMSRLTVGLLASLAVIQLALPLRHFAEPGNVRWNEDGYYLAWRVMLTEKAGFVDYQVTDTATGRTWTVSPDVVLTDWQGAHAATRPDLIHQTAHLIEQELSGADRSLIVEIRADAWVSMNGRATARILDPDIDLLAYERGQLPAGAVTAIPPAP